MGFRVNVTGGAEQISFDERSITKVEFYSDTPDDSNARARDIRLSVKIWGKMNFSLGGQAVDSTLGTAKWAQVPAERADCYRNAVVEVVSAGQMVRQYTFPNAFVVEYTEDLDDEAGVGQFYLHLKQKKDLNTAVQLNGGFGA